MGFFYFGKRHKLIELQNILFDNISNKLILSEKELYSTAKKQAQIYIDYIQESLQIVNTTSLPQLYFENFESVLYFGNKLLQLEPYISFSNNSPSKSLEEIERKEQESIYAFLERYLENFCSHSNKKISPTVRYEWFTEPLKKYYSRFNTENIKYIETYCKNEIYKIVVNKQELPQLLKTDAFDFDLLQKAIELIIENQSPYASFLNRHLDITYSESIRIINFFENIGFLNKNDDGTTTILISIEESKTSQHTIEIADNMAGYEFEKFCCMILENNGYINVTQTKLSGDNGIDVLAEKNGIKYAIQCKCYTGKLGNKAIQEAYTGLKMYNCDIGVVMTNSHFTESAINTAEQTRIRLWDRDYLINMLDKT